MCLTVSISIRVSTRAATTFLRMSAQELTDAERALMPVPPSLAPAASVDDIDLPS